MSTQLLDEDLDIMEFIDLEDSNNPPETTELPSEEEDIDVQNSTLQFVTAYLKHTNIPVIHEKVKRDNQIMEWLSEYHAYPKDTDDPDIDSRKKYLKDCIILNTFFLLPYVLSKKQLPINIFEDAIQTIIINLLRAIENYKPSSNSKFSSYITGYIKDGIKVTLHKEQFIYMPLHKRFQKKMKKKDGTVFIKPAEQLPVSISLNEVTCEITPSSLNITDNAMYGSYDEQLYEGSFVAYPYMQDTDKEFCEEFCKNINDHIYTTHEDKILATLQMLLHPQHTLLTPLEKFIVIHYNGLFGRPQLTYNKLSEILPNHFEQKVNKNSLSQIHKNGITKIQNYFKELNLKFNMSM